MSLIDRATELEYYPEQQLIQMSQDPQGQYPQFLVLSEIQRRNNMRRMYQNEVNKMNQPSTTVAEEAVMEFAGQGAVPMMDASSSLSSTSEGGLRSMAPIPMQNDVIPMQEGRRTALEQSFVAPGRNPIPMSAASSSNLRGGLSDLAESLGLIDEEGNIDPVQASLLGLTFVPGVGLAARLGQGLFKAGKFLAPKAKSFFMKPNPVRAKGLQPNQRVVIDPKKGLGSKKLIDTTTGKVIPEEVVNVRKVLGVAGGVASPFAVSNIFAPDDTSVEQGDSDDKQLTAEELEIQRLKKALAEANKIESSSKPAKKGLSADDALTLAQIGGVFGGARNLGEAAVGLGNLAAQIQKTRREDIAEGLQGRFVEANIAKLEADIADMEPKQINAQLATVQDLIKNAIDSGNQEQLDELFLYQQVLNRKLLELRGISLPQGGDLTEGIAGVTIT